MILRKPYALLIKYFRVIHIILTLLTIFIAYKSYDIISLFQNYVNNNYSITVTENLVSNTIGTFLYIAIIIVIIALIAVFILLKNKKKQTRAYSFAIVYYIILLVMVIISSVLIGSLSGGLWESAAARTYRDIGRIVYYPQFIFIVIMFIRSLGFNIKQFNFKDDLKELEITEEDSEEIELNLNFQTYKAERRIRRLIRELKYYVLENKIIIIIVGVILFGVVIYLVYSNYEKTTYTYNEGDTFSYGDFTINILDSIITNVDYNGNSIYNGKYFLVVKFEITNNTSYNQSLSYNYFKVYYGSSYSTPTLDLGTYFKDYGDPFMNQSISAGSTNTYILAYIIPEDSLNSDFYISLYLGTAEKTQAFVAKTAKIKLSPNSYLGVETVRNAKLGEVISLASTTLGDSTITITNAEITQRYEYTYESCYSTTCREYSGVVVADNTYQIRQVLIVMDYDLSLDSSSSSYKNINDLNAFASSFMQIEYVLDGVSTISNVTYATPTKVSDKLILQTDSYVSSAEEVNLLITIRNNRFIINLM